jgi:hypothetical protein
MNVDYAGGGTMLVVHAGGSPASFHTVTAQVRIWSTVAQCRAVLDKHHLLPQFPAAVRTFSHPTVRWRLQSQGCCGPGFHTLLSAENLADAAPTQAEFFGFTTVVDNSCDDSDFELAVDYLLPEFEPYATRTDEFV